MIEKKEKKKRMSGRVAGEKVERKINLQKAFISHLLKFPLDGSNIPGIRLVRVLGKG